MTTVPRRLLAVRRPRLDARGRLLGERGSASIEMVILAPAFGLLIAMLVMGGRIAIAQQSIQSAAGEAARAASLERGADSRDRGLSAARAFLAEQDMTCRNLDVQLDASGKQTDPGVADQIVNATVSCEVPLGDLALPGIGGGHTVTATAASPVDTYRER